MEHDSPPISPIERLTTSDLAPSSEMWGDDTVRLDGAYHIAASSLQPDEGSCGGGYTRLVVATRYGRKLMLKTLREDVRGVLQYEELLRKEFEILFALNHNNIVRAFAMDEVEGLGHCIVMEYVEGMTLAQWLERDDHEATDDAKRAILSEVLHTVDYLHGRGVLHRDLTLANIIVLPDDRHIRLIDFGFADSAAYEVLKQPCGTPGFVAPEQRAGISDVRNDIYSLGCIMQAMQLGPSYAPVIARCLLPLAERSASVGELLQACNPFQHPATDKRPFLSFLLIPAILSIIAVCAWLLMPSNPADAPVSPAEQSSATQVPADSINMGVQEKSAQTVIAATEGRERSSSSSDVSSRENEIEVCKRLMAEGQRMIDRDARRIDQIMDTVSRKESMPADYIDFLSTESKKIHQFAVSHQSSIPTHYAAFYDSLFSYYTIHYAAKWAKRHAEL